MLEVLFGNRTAGNLLLYLEGHSEGFANQIARDLGIPLNMIQGQLRRFERGGLLVGFYRKRNKIYRLNRFFPLLNELRAILRKALLKKGTWLIEKDPADGTHLSPRERLQLAASLTQQAELLNPHRRYQPFVRSFESFEKYETWRKKQKNPWLV